jgi:hypothetical protein
MEVAVNRRTFLESSALAAGGLVFGRPAFATGDAGQAGTRPTPPMIGIQVGAVSFVDEGTERVLDVLQQTGAVNTLFLATFTYGRGIAGRQPRGTPLPDHGKQEYDDDFHGGVFSTPHPGFYKGTSIVPEKAPDHRDYDLVADVLPAARRRGMKVYCWFEDVFRRDLRGLDQAVEIDLHGRPTTRTCPRNPNTRNFWLGMVEDDLRSYDVDGVMWGSERQGPLNNAIGASHGGGGDPATVGCFCPHCLDAAKQMGIDAARAREGYTALESWVKAMRDGRKPTDGAFVTFWRILVQWPEVLAWERLWNEGLHDTYRDMYRKAREVAPSKGIGWHLWHTNSFAPFYRAEQDYAEFSKYSDFLKVVMYNNSGGPRMAQYVRNIQRTIFGDLTPEQTLDLTYRLQQYEGEKPLDRIPQEGLSADYVRRETKRAVAGVSSAVRIWPGIDIDIPTGATEKKTQPDDVYAAVKAAFDGGAHGVLLSRKYSEMRLANLGAAGRAVRELR